MDSDSLGNFSGEALYCNQHVAGGEVVWKPRFPGSHPVLLLADFPLLSLQVAGSNVCGAPDWTRTLPTSTINSSLAHLKAGGNTEPVRNVSYGYDRHTDKRTESEAAPGVARRCRRCAAVVALVCRTDCRAGRHALRNVWRTRVRVGCPGVVGVLQPGAVGRTLGRHRPDDRRGWLATSRIIDKSIATGMMGFMFPMYSIPVLSLALVAGAVVGRRLSDGPRRASMVASDLACVRRLHARADQWH